MNRRALRTPRLDGCGGTFQYPWASLAMKKRRQIGVETLDLLQGRQDTTMLQRYRLVLVGTSLALVLTLAGCGQN